MRRKIYLYIQNELADLADESFVLFNYTVEDLSNPTIVRNSWSQQITLPGTAKNNRIFGYAYRTDRQTDYDDYYHTGLHFDASYRTPFSLVADTGELLESGYLKLDEITRNGNRYAYKVTLYGGLGGFLYGLAYDADGNKRSLADLKYLGSSEGDTQMDFVINADSVRYAWRDILDTANYNRWNVINFAPTYDGMPSGVFDADKAIVRPSVLGLPIPEDYEAPDGWTLVALPGKHTGIDVRDVRSYLQRPVVSVKRIIDAIAQDYNNGGYEVELDASFFNENNPYYARLWMTLPMLDTLQYNIDVRKMGGAGEDLTVNYTISFPDTFTAGANYVTKVIITPIIHGDFALHSFWDIHGESAGTFFQNWYTIRIDLLDANQAIISTDIKRISSASPLHEGVPAIDYVGQFVTQTGNTSAKFGPEQVELIAEGYEARAFRVTIQREGITWGEPPSDTFTDNAISSGDIEATTWAYDFEYEITRTTGSSARTGMTITKRLLLGGTKTPADYLVSYCKMFGLMLTYDRVAKKVSIIPRRNFYDGVSGAIDLTTRVNLSKVITIAPFTYNARWYEFSQEPVPADFLEYYERVYGLRYGAQRVNTGYGFNADINRLLDGNAFKVAPEVQEISKYYSTFSVYRGGNSYTYDGIFIDTGATYELLDAARNKETFDVPPIPFNASHTYWNTDEPGRDYISRLQLHGGDNKAIGGEDVLVFYEGRINPQYDVPGLALTDDLPIMGRLNGNTPCWLLNMGEYMPEMRIAEMPVFKRFHFDEVSGVKTLTASLDFGIPAELYMPDGFTVPVESTIYEQFWKTYIQDRYDDDSKVLTCWVNLAGLQVGQDLLRRFFYWDGALWALNRVINHSLTTFDDTQCEFVKVQDKLNYTT